jgi:hypothetical protein
VLVKYKFGEILRILGKAEQEHMHGKKQLVSEKNHKKKQVKHWKKEDTRKKEEAQKRADGIRKKHRKNQLNRTRKKASLVFSFTHWSNIHRPRLQRKREVDFDKAIAWRSSSTDCSSTAPTVYSLHQFVLR